MPTLKTSRARPSAKTKAKPKAKKPASRSGYINVGHFDGETSRVHVSLNDTIKQAFAKASIDIDKYDDAEINTLNAQKVGPNSKVKPGVTYLLSGNYDNG